ncbi:MAG: Tim44/TimA family putative adaptor protein [Xanthobacteraceae bacterium]|nr:Tim44/TimA family putative adaptor protein [Xanthobacteraceae bacterium]
MSVLLTILWLGWVYWQITSAMNHLRDEEQRKKTARTAWNWASGPVRHALAPDRPPAVAGEDRWTDVLIEIEQRDPSFTLASFLDGATSVYEAITAAFASGDCNSLRALVSHDVYDAFVSEVMTRECAPERTELSLLHIQPPEAQDIRVLKDEAEITVRFVGEFFETTYIPGRQPPTPTRCTHVDVWTFSKCLSSREAGWVLVAAN